MVTYTLKDNAGGKLALVGNSLRTTSALSTSLEYTLTATDENGWNKDITRTVAFGFATLTIAGTPADAAPNTTYTFAPVVSGGSGVNSFSFAGKLLPGQSFVGGGISGTPTVQGISQGIITVTSSDGQVAELPFAFACFIPDVAPTTVGWIAPTPKGTGDGSSFANAMGFSAANISTLIAANDAVYLSADDGAYATTSESILSAGGTLLKRKVIRGAAANGTPKYAVVSGTRLADATLDTRGTEDAVDSKDFLGNTAFRLNAGANHLAISYLRFENIGICFYARSTLTNVSIHHIQTKNIRRYFDNDTGPVTALQLRDTTGYGWSKSFVRLTRDSSDILCRSIIGDSRRQAEDNFALGMSSGNASTDTVHDLLMDDCQFDNLHYSVASGSTVDPTGLLYKNCDPFSFEGVTYRIFMRNCRGKGCTDGGVDMKSTDLILQGCVMEGNKRNMRFHKSGYKTLFDCTTISPKVRGDNGSVGGNRPTHIGAYDGADVRIVRHTFIDSDPTAVRLVVDDGVPAIVRIDGTQNVSGSVGIPLVNATGGLVYETVPVADKLADPIVTSQLNWSLAEEQTLGIPLVQSTAGGLPVSYVLDSASAGISLSGFTNRDVAQRLDVVAQDYEALTSKTLTASLRVTNSARRTVTYSPVVNITDVAGDGGGSVSYGSTEYWRVHAVDKASDITLSANRKTVTKTTGAAAGYSTARSGAAFVPVQQAQRRRYFEAVVQSVSDKSKAAISLFTYSGMSKAPGTSRHRFDVMLDGKVMLGATQIGDIGVLAVGDVIGVEPDSNVPFENDDPALHNIFWWRRKVVITKNGVVVSSGSVVMKRRGGTVVTETDGFDITSLTGALFAGACLYTAGDSITFRSAPTEWQYTPPNGGIAWGMVQQIVVSGAGARHVSPSGSGTKDGSSWDNAAPYSQLAALWNGLSNGGTTNGHILLRSDLGGYSGGTTTLTGGGGTSSNRLHIIGCDGNYFPEQPIYTGTRSTSWLEPENEDAYTDAGSFGDGGGQMLTFVDTKYFRVAHLFARHAAGVIKLNRDHNDIILERLGGFNLRRAIVDTYDSSPDANNIRPWLGRTSTPSVSDNDYALAISSAVNVVVRDNWCVGFSKPGINLRSASHDWLIERNYMDAAYQDRDGFGVGFKFEDMSHTSILRFNQAYRCVDTENSYKQGDGFESNQSQVNIQVSCFAAKGMADGGMDAKGPNALYDGVMAYQCKRSFRNWEPGATKKNMVSAYPRGPHDPIATPPYTFPEGTHFHIRGTGDFSGTQHLTGDRFADIVVDGVTVYAAETDQLLYFEEKDCAVRFTNAAKVYMGSNLTAEDLSAYQGTQTPLGADRYKYDAGSGTQRLLFTPTPDTTKPVINSATTIMVIDGSVLQFTPTVVGNEPATWEVLKSPGVWGFTNGVVDLQRPMAQAPTLQLFNNVAAVYDSTTPANNAKTFQMRARDGSGNYSDPVTHTIQVVLSDQVPDAFVFTDVSNAELSTVFTSNTITVSGINVASPISITGGTYSKNGGAYTSASGTVVNGDTITVRNTSSGSFTTTVDAILTIGGVSDTFSIVSKAAPVGWQAPTTNAPLSSTSSTMTITETTGATEGDLQIVCIGYQGTTPVTPPAGWTQIAPEQATGNTSTGASNARRGGVMFGRIRGASAGDLTFTRSGGTTAWRSQLLSYKGAAANPFDGAGSSNFLTTASTTVTTGGLVTTTIGQLVIAFVAGALSMTSVSISSADGATGPAASLTVDTTTAPQTDKWTHRVAASSSTQCSLFVADMVKSTVASTGTITALMSGAALHAMFAATFKKQ